MKIGIIVMATLVVCVALLSGCAQKPTEMSAETIYVNGHIITINDHQPSVEALAVKDGKIQAVGHRVDIEKSYKGKTTRIVDLSGRTLLPGFLDAHSHYYSSLSVANQVNLYAPPSGPGKDIPSIIEALKKFRDANQIPKGVLIQAYGYDDNVMPAGIGLSRDDLDKDFPDNPVLVGHVSMHGAVLNSQAMKRWNISAETATPVGGIILRKADSNEPAGLIMETAYLPIFSTLPQPTTGQEVEWSQAGQMLYAAAGITTAHEGATHEKDLALMQRVADQGANIIDIVVYPFITDLDKILVHNPPETFGKYINRLKIGGVKITADGSPQGKTAFFSEPYLTGGPGGEENWYGESTFPEDQISEMVKRVYAMGLPLNFHANGDAAIDTFLRAHESAIEHENSPDHNVTIIHSQFVRPDQLDKYAQYNIRPSFYTLHTYYFAEAHIANRGRQQAEYLSPMRDAIDRDLMPTNHTDFVVAPLDQMFMLWSAVNRISRDGQLIGGEQRISPVEALKTMTINVAYQYGEQDRKGSLEPGKLADLVILDDNPLTIDPMKIRDIKVLETIKEGKTIFRSQ